MDPNMGHTHGRLSMISSGEVNAKADELGVMVGTISDPTAALYTRGLAVAALGAYLSRNEAPDTVNSVVGSCLICTRGSSSFKSNLSPPHTVMQHVAVYLIVGARLGAHGLPY